MSQRRQLAYIVVIAFPAEEDSRFSATIKKEIREYDCRAGHAVQIEPGLRPRSPENGNISKTCRRLSAIPPSNG